MDLRRVAPAFFLVSVPLSVLPALLGFYSGYLGATPVQTAGLFSVFSLLVLLLRPAIGRLWDRRGGDDLLCLALAFYLLSFLLLSQARWVGLLYLGRMVQAVGGALLGVCSLSLAASQGNTGVAQAQGRLDAWQGYGGIAGYAICWWALYTPDFGEGWRRFLLVGAACGAAGLGFALAGRRAPHSPPQPPAKGSPGPAAAPPLGQGGSLAPVLWLRGLLSLFGSLLAVVFLLYLQQVYQAPLQEIAAAFVLPLLLDSLLSQPLGRLSDRLGAGRSLGLGLPVAALCLAVFPLLPRLGLTSLWAASGLWCVYSGASTLCDLSLPALAARVGVRLGAGERSGRLSLWSGLGAAAGPVLGGVLFQAAAGLPFWAAALGLGLLALWMWVFGSHTKMLQEDVG